MWLFKAILEFLRNIFHSFQRKSPIGGGDHDYIPHGHDYIPHGKDTVKHFSILGGDTRDFLPHGDAKCAEHVPAFIEFKNKYKRVYESNEGKTEFCTALF